MGVFLFLKQIIDVFYSVRFGDYFLAVYAVGLILIQIWHNRPDDNEKIRIKLLVPDICVIILGAVLLINMMTQLSTDHTYQLFYMYGKIGSALLLYLLGRLCYRRIDECHFAIVSSSYIVIYSNLIYRIYNLGKEFFSSYTPNGDLYYYDIDMAFSITMSFVFVAVLGKNTIIKFITIFGICPFMVYHSEANIQKALFFVLLVILFIYMGERAVKKRRFTNFILPLSIITMVAVLVLIVAPVFTGNTENGLVTYLCQNIIGNDNLLYRYSTWQSLWNDFGLSTVREMLIGKGLPLSFQVENAYIAIIYSTGIIGITAAATFVLSISSAATKIHDRPFYYITIMLAILFLGTCINKNGMEFTQMSWFTMLFFGMGATISDNKPSDVIESDDIEDIPLDID